MGSLPSRTLAVAEPTGHREVVTAEVVDEVTRFIRMLKAHAAGPTGTDRSSLMLLWPLMVEGPKRLRDLAEAKGVDQSTASRQADQLVKVGLVRREPDPADRRARLVVLTERGRQVCQEMAAARRQGITDALAGWDDARIGEFAAMFRDFNHAIARHLVSEPTGSNAAMPNPSAEHDHRSTSGAEGAASRQENS